MGSRDGKDSDILRFAHFRLGSRNCFGAAIGSSLLPFSSLPESSPYRDSTLDDFLRKGQSAADALGGQFTQKPYSGMLVDEGEAEFLPCVPSPSKILCVGLNYRTHATETGMPIPEVPVIFSKFSDTVAGHRCEIPVPPFATQIDYEGELGILIGRETYMVDEKQALDHVFGYFAANDVSARDIQLRTSQWLIGKTCESFCPIGPYVVTPDEVVDPDSLRIQTKVNGKIRQDSNTSDMIFSCSRIISYISRYIRMRPGDIILTGTPSGVILGKPEGQRVWLKKGDEVEITVERVGTLTNRFA